MAENEHLMRKELHFQGDLDAQTLTFHNKFFPQQVTLCFRAFAMPVNK